MRSFLTWSGVAIALAGADKLAGYRGYKSMFRHLGWSPDQMRAAAGAETLGGVLMIPPATRRIGGAIVAAVSTTLLLSEVRHRDAKLAAPRAAVLLAALAALIAPAR